MTTQLVQRLERCYIPEPNSGCWLWLGTIGLHGGYAMTCVSGKRLYAHRVLYELHVGPIPAGLDLDHLCRVRSCVNPRHLEPVTRKENMRRGVLPRGERRWNAKLTATQVQDIKRRLANRSSMQKDLAAEYGVCASTIQLIAAGRNWKSVQPLEDDDGSAKVA